jgi:glucosyl-3-phosphoglycerate phosphatase
LSALGEEQAERAAQALAGLQVSRVVSSDLRRARRTAAIIARRLELPEPAVEPGLREISVGEWTGLTRPQIEARWPNLLGVWAEGKLEATPGGESLTALRSRVTDAVHRVLEAVRPADETITVLVVSHRRAISGLEEASGIRPVRAGHLAGRRFVSAGPGELVPGEPIDLLGVERPASAADHPGYG